MLEKLLNPDQLVAATADPIQALFAAVVLYAVKDVRSPDSPHAAEARTFIESVEFEHICAWLEFNPDRWRALALSAIRSREHALASVPGWKPYMRRKTPEELREYYRVRAQQKRNAKKRPCPGCGQGMYVKQCHSCAALAREARFKQEGRKRGGRRVEFHLPRRADQLVRPAA